MNQDLPFSLGEKLKDGSAKQKVMPMVEQLKTTFQQSVYEPATQEAPDLSKARAGLEECMGIVAQMKEALGG